MLSARQIKAARALLDWSQRYLAEMCDATSEPTIKLIEAGKVNSTPSTLLAIQKTFEDHGVEFLPQDGVRMRSSEIRIFEGQKGFLDFYEDVYLTIKDSDDRRVYVSNTEEKEFEHRLGDYAEQHRKRMVRLNAKFYVLVKEGDPFMPVSEYAEYKWLPENLFGTVPFYLYGEKLAIILFTPDIKIFILHNKQIRDAYVQQFNTLWDMAIIPEDKNNSRVL